MLDLPIETRLRGTYVLGKNGTGKSSLLIQFIARDLVNGHGLAVLDPHGDLIADTFVMMEEFAKQRSRDLVFLDLHDTEYPFAFNLFACADPDDELAVGKTAELVTAVFKRVWGDAIGPRSQDVLENTVHALVANPGATLDDVTAFLTKEPVRRRFLQRVHNDVVRSYWEDEFASLSAASQQQITAPILNKVRGFLRNSVLRNIVRQPAAPDFDEILNDGKVLLVRLNNELPEATSLLGTMITLRLLHAALGRAKSAERRYFFLYADEFQRFATPDFGTLLQEARKYNIGTVLAHQLRVQLDRELRSFVLGAGTIICFQLSAEDAREMGREFAISNRLPPEALPPPETSPWRWLCQTEYSSPDLKDAVDRANELATTLRTTWEDNPWAKETVDNVFRYLNGQLREAIQKRDPGKFTLMHYEILRPMPRYTTGRYEEKAWPLYTMIENFESAVQRALAIMLDPTQYSLDRLPLLSARVRTGGAHGPRIETIRVSYGLTLAEREEMLNVLQGKPATTEAGRFVLVTLIWNRLNVATERKLFSERPKPIEEEEGVIAEEPPPKRQPTTKRRRIFD